MHDILCAVVLSLKKFEISRRWYTNSSLLSIHVRVSWVQWMLSSLFLLDSQNFQQRLSVVTFCTKIMLLSEKSYWIPILEVNKNVRHTFTSINSTGYIKTPNSQKLVMERAQNLWKCLSSELKGVSLVSTTIKQAFFYDPMKIKSGGHIWGP